MIKSFLSDVFLKYFLVAFGLVQLGVFSPQAQAVLPIPTRPTSFPLSPVSYTTPGTVVVWGSNFTIPGGLSNVVQVAAGDGHSLALQSDGTVVAWGYGAYGQWDVPSGLSSVVQVAAGGDQSLALKSNGTVVAWGYGGNLPSGLSNVVQVASGGSQSLALKRDGTVVIWGDYSWHHRFQDFFPVDPPYVPVGLINVVQVAAGDFHRLALKSDGTVVGWGIDDSYGQKIIPVGLSNVVQVAAGGYHSLALKSDGTVVAWGLNSQAQATVPGGLSNVVQVAAGETHSLALKSDGTVVGWGYDGDGQATIPGGLSNVFQVAAGGSQSLALNIPLSQTIRSFATIPTKRYGTGTFTVTAPVATSGLPVTLSVVSGPATISGNTVTLTGVGTVVLAANQAGNVGVSAATRVTASFVINKGSQTIAKFAPISKPSSRMTRKTGMFSLFSSAVTTPVATSGLPVTVTVRSGPGSMDEGRLYPLSKGIVVLVATQAGNANYTPAVPVTCKVVFNKDYPVFYQFFNR